MRKLQKKGGKSVIISQESLKLLTNLVRDSQKEKEEKLKVEKELLKKKKEDKNRINKLRNIFYLYINKYTFLEKKKLIFLLKKNQLKLEKEKKLKEKKKKLKDAIIKIHKEKENKLREKKEKQRKLKEERKRFLKILKLKKKRKIFPSTEVKNITIHYHPQIYIKTKNRLRKKFKRIISKKYNYPHGYKIGKAYIKVTLNNIFVTITDFQGQVITSISSGKTGVHTFKRKCSNYSAFKVARIAAMRMYKYKKKRIKYIELFIVSFRVKRILYQVLKGFLSVGIEIVFIRDFVSRARNGVRKKKPRRL